jgi:hypothetical protein
MAERRQIGSLAQAGPIEQLSQKAVLDGRAHGVNPSGRSKKVECHCFSFLQPLSVPISIETTRTSTRMNAFRELIQQYR